jgi:hypothetical protein
MFLTVLSSLRPISNSQATQAAVTTYRCLFLVVQATATLLAVTGWVPGVLARQRNLPHWKRTFFVGLFGSIVFFPLTLILLAKVYQKSPASKEGHSGVTAWKEPVNGGGSL